MRGYPYFPFYSSEWLNCERTAIASHAAKGAQCDLLCLAWESADCSIPNDVEALRTLVRWVDDPGEDALLWPAAFREIRPLWEEDGNRLYSPKLRDFAAKMRSKSESASASAKSRYERSANAVRPRKRTQSESASERTAIRSDQNRLDKKEEPPVVPLAKGDAPRKRVARSHEVPEGFEKTAERTAYATKCGLSPEDADFEWRSFKECRFKSPHHDWELAWQGWCRRAANSQPKGRGPRVAEPHTRADVMDHEKTQAYLRDLAAAAERKGVTVG